MLFRFYTNLFPFISSDSVTFCNTAIFILFRFCAGNSWNHQFITCWLDGDNQPGTTSSHACNPSSSVGRA